MTKPVITDRADGDRLLPGSVVCCAVPGEDGCVPDSRCRGTRMGIQGCQSNVRRLRCKCAFGLGSEVKLITTAEQVQSSLRNGALSARQSQNDCTECFGTAVLDHHVDLTLSDFLGHHMWRNY